MKLRQLEFFVRAAHIGSLTAAAKVLHVSQPALGQQIQELEDELGVNVFTRGARGVTLTEAGAVLLNHAEDVLARIEATKGAMRMLRDGSEPELKLGTPPTPSRLLVPDLMVRLHASHGIRIMSRAGLSEDLARLIEDGRIDAALCYDSDSSEDHDETPLLEESMFLVGVPSIVDATAGDIPFIELPSFPLVLDNRYRATRRRIEDAARQCRVALDVSFDVEAIDLRHELLKTHNRCTIVPIGAYFDAISAGELAARRIVNPELKRTLSLLTRRGLDKDLRDKLAAMTRSLVREKAASGSYWWTEVQAP